MPHITLGLSEEIYKEMKRHLEIKWSEVARESIAARLMKMKKVSHAKEIRAHLDHETLSSISRMSEAKAKKLYKKAVREEWKHTKYLTRAR